MSKGPRVLAVDLDGTLVRTDLLHETFWNALGRDWTTLPAAALGLARGKAALKHRLAGLAALDCATLPFNEPVVAYVREWKDAGGRTALVTASHQSLAQDVADHVGLFDEVIASDGARNLNGAAKAELLAERFGEGGFAYAGDHSADWPVWQKAGKALTVGASAGLRTRVDALDKEAHHFRAERAGLGAYVRAARPHQWLKNLLVFVPMLAAHDFSEPTALASLTAFLAFCLTASAVYMLNDLLDLGPDRAHPRKRHRPFAAGTIPIARGIWLAVLLWAGGIAIGATLSATFLLVLGAYFAASLAYSLVLKKRMVIDVFTLAALYTSRIAAGGVAAGVVLSEWLLAFAIFFFLALAAVKRQAELVQSVAPSAGKLSGRGYVKDDLPLVSQMAITAGYVSVLVLAMYLNSDAVTVLYSAPFALWGICLVLLYWISRMAMVAHRGDMHDDPLVYAVTDPKSLVCGVLVVGFAAVASYW